MRVGVSDAAPGFPIPQDHRVEAPHGRGLHIVSTLADAWGVEMQRHPPGKTVWFSAPLPGVAVAGAPSERSGSTRPMRRDAAITSAAAARDGRPGGRRHAHRPGPAPGVRAVLDALRDAVVATDGLGADPVRQRGRRGAHGLAPGSLIGRSALDIVARHA